MEQEISTNSLNYEFVFQNVKYTRIDFERYYFSKEANGESVEFLPGIFYEINQKYSFVLKILIYISSLLSGQCQIINAMVARKKREDKYVEKTIKIQFKNKRDEYSFYIDNVEQYTHKKQFHGKNRPESMYKDHYEYETNGSTECRDIDTKNIYFPYTSGGDGDRCSLKGKFKEEGILTICSNDGYNFFDEYEMHCLTEQVEEVKNICNKCKKCMTILDMLKEGKFTDLKDSDCLKVKDCDGRYIIMNGNHRACCAKTFGISTMMAKVYKCERKEKPNFKEESHKNNQKVLDTFYETFKKRGIGIETVRSYLEKEGDDTNLLKILGII